MKKLGAVAVLGAIALSSAFGQLYAGESFSAPAKTNVSLNGGKLVLQATTAFTGSCLAGALAPSAPQLIPGTCYSIGPGGLGVTYTVTVKYNAKSLPSGVSASNLRLYEVVNNEWAAVSGSTVNTSETEVTGTLTSTATFAVLSGAPAKFEGNIYYHTFFGGDATIYRYYAAQSANSPNAFAEPLANLAGLSGVALPTYTIGSPTRNFLGFVRQNPSGAFDFYTCNIDGSNPVLLAGPWAGANGAAFSGDGTTVYASVVKPGSTAWNIIKITIATGATTTVHSGGSTGGPVWGNGVLAYSDGTTITTISSTGTVKTFSSPAAHGSVDQGMDLSNDGTKLLWSTDDGTIYSATVSGGSIKALGITGANPHWSPDGSMFTYQSDTGVTFVASISSPTNGLPMFGPNGPSANVVIWR